MKDIKAFPAVIEDQSKPFLYEEGMDLRDYFAAKAMQALLQSAEAEFLKDPDHKQGYNDSDIADYAYAMATAMMEARGE